MPISLAQAPSASGAPGKPISAKFEMEDGKLVRSGYLAKNAKYFEVIVDLRSGQITKTEEIKEGDNLAAAKAQNEAMSRAKRSLHAAAL